MGSLDTGFGSSGKVITDIDSNDDAIRALALQSDGKIIAAGTSKMSSDGNKYSLAVLRYNTDGTLDTNFDSDGKIYQGGSKIILGVGELLFNQMGK